MWIYQPGWESGLNVAGKDIQKERGFSHARAAFDVYVFRRIDVERLPGDEIVADKNVHELGTSANPSPIGRDSRGGAGVLGVAGMLSAAPRCESAITYNFDIPRPVVECGW